MNVLVIGSSLFDAIVSLENNPFLTISGNKASFSLGEKIPVDIKAFAIGGNAPNVSSALKKLSIPNSLYTYLGTDALSSYIRNQLEKEGISVFAESTSVENGPLSLIFDFKTDRTIFSHHAEFEHGFDEHKVSQKPTHIYLTSIGKSWEKAYENVLSYALRENIPVAFSPGSQQMKNMNEVFIKTIHQAKMLFCNLEEANTISENLTGEKIEDTKEMLLNLKNNGFELLSVTNGANGAFAVDNAGKVYKIPSLPPQGHEKTGAGDAYAAAFLASYLQELSIEQSMKRGVLNALGVMSRVGAHTGQLLAEELETKANATELIAQII